MILRTAFAFLFLLPTLHAGDILLKDDFTGPEHESRRAMRGDWRFEGGAASVTQDDELYRKFKDHGPILFYDLEHVDASVSFAFKAEGSKTVVFTMNGEAGHVFRVVLSDRGVNVRAFPPDAEAKSIAIGQAPAPKLEEGAWTKVRFSLRGETATVTVGSEFEESFTHPSLARPKTNLSIGFSFGTFEVKDLVVSD